MKRWLVVAGLLAAPAVGTPTAAGVSAEVVVDATGADGSLGVTMRWHGLPPGPQTLYPLGDRAFRIRDLVVRAEGEPIETEKVRDGWTFRASGPFEVQYRVTPGGDGRHGHQGAVASDWAVTDGRIFAVPRHGVDPASIQLSFVLPEGWVAATPFEPVSGAPDRFLLEPDGALGADQLLAGACFGLGRFEQVSRGSATVWAYAPWPAEHKQELASGSTAMADWFRTHTGLEGDYTVVWTPRFEGGRVFGGSWGRGTCYDNPPASDRSVRDWQLLGHRLAHAQNKYAPESLVLRDLRDHWFLEGWAAYAEVVATEAVGLAKPGTQLDRLYARHHTILGKHPEWAFPLAREPDLPDELHEYVHYTVAPLAVAQLDHWLQQRSGTTLAAFMGWLDARYARFAKPVDLREALATFTGHRYDDFFAVYVDRVATFPPIWRTPRGEREVVGTAAGFPVTADLLRALGASGDVERFDQLLVRLGAAEQRLADLERRGVLLAPAALLGERHRLEGRAQLDLLRAAEAYPIGLAPEPPSRGCSGPTPLPAPIWRTARSGRDAAELDALVALEGEAVRDRVERVAVRYQGDQGAETLVVGDQDDVSVMVRWIGPPARLWIDQYLDDTLVRTKDLVPQPTWARTWSSFPADKRSEGQGVMRFVVRDAHGIRATHAVWQVPGSTR